MLARTVVPRPAADSTTRVPPSAPIRSDMFASPWPALAGRSGVVAEAVVDDLEVEPAIALPEPNDGGRTQAGVLVDVLETLHAAEVDGGLDVFGVAADRLGLELRR